MSTFTIADSFDDTRRLGIDWSAPLPLGHHAAVARALELRNATNMSYQSIATVMAQYHGCRRGPDAWRQYLLEAGAEKRPRGAPFPRAA